ncbi:MAG: cytochrome C oxidase subunit IV family protein [Elusimicrobiota bacterium]
MTNDEHNTGYGALTAVWAALLLLTGALVAVSLIRPELALWAMVFVTPFKTALVLYYFMHLRHEGLALRTMVFTAFAVLFIFISMMFLDISFR